MLVKVRCNDIEQGGLARVGLTEDPTKHRKQHPNFIFMNPPTSAIFPPLQCICNNKSAFFKQLGFGEYYIGGATLLTDRKPGQAQ